jgi:hypothetical protein
MREFWLFRSNLKSFENYHQYKDLETFEKHCHDFYMLFPLWLLRSGEFDRVVIWRLSDTPVENIIFYVDGKLYIQRWVKNFNETIYVSAPDVSFFRGGFKEYDLSTRINPKHFGNKLYLGAGKRIIPQYGGIYDVILMEDERDIKTAQHKPFYKTAASSIFYDKNLQKKDWDICWPCNFEQLKYKGQEDFIKAVSNDTRLKNLKIVHCGNKPEIGKKMCENMKVNNITFVGSIDRSKLNDILNQSYFGLNCSNQLHGCPRTSTEILMARTPLIIHENTRLLNYYKEDGVVVVNNKNVGDEIINAVNNYSILKNELLNDKLTMDTIMQKNMEIWNKGLREKIN